MSHLKKPIRALSRFQEAHPLGIFIVILMVTVFFGYHAIRIETDASFDSMYREDSNTLIMKNFAANEFGSTDTLFVLYQIDDSVEDDNNYEDIRHPKILESIKDLQQTLSEESTVASTFSVVNALEEQYGSLPQDLNQSKDQINNLLIGANSMVARDHSSAIVIVSVNIQNKVGSLAEVQSVIEKKIEQASSPVGVSLILTGQPTMLNRIMNLLINDNINTIAIALIFIFIILWYSFRSPTTALFTIIPVVVTLIWLGGTLKLLNIRINMMIAAIGAMMVGMGVDYAIHMAHGFHHNMRKGKKHPTEETVQSVGSALFASALTTVAGFLAMLFAYTPSPRIQGTVLSIGIFYAFITTLVLLPCLMILQRNLFFGPLQNLVFRVGISSQRAKENFRVKMLRLLAKFQTKSPWLIVGVFVAATVLIVPGAANLRFDTDNANWIPDGDPVIDAFSDVAYQFGGTEQMNIFVMLDNTQAHSGAAKDIREKKVITFIEAIDESLEKIDYINDVRSPIDNLRALNGGKIPHDIEEIKTLIAKYPSVRSGFNADYSAVKMTIVADAFGDPKKEEPDKNYFRLLDEINSLGVPDGVYFRLQGGPADFAELGQRMQQDTGFTAMIGFIFVFTVAALLYRSLLVGAMAFFPIVFSILWTVGIMGWVDLPFTVLTSGMLSIVMGIGIDFSIHLIHKTKEFLNTNHSIEDSILHSLTSTGEAIFMSTITTAIGFISLLLASLLVTQRLGLTLALAIASCFICCIMLIPAVLTIEYNIKNKKKLRGTKQ